MSKRKLVPFIIGFLLLSASFVKAVELLEEGKMIIPDRTSEKIKIDADFSEKVWSKAPISEKFMSFVPIYGKELTQKTDIWMAYDSRNLYFAFKCYDTEPGKIKTSISQRDNIGRDDWIGVAIDSMGNRQSSFEFVINASGIQSDTLYSTAGGWDKGPDFVWESAGKVTDEGYQVEIAIPLENLRFKSGKEVKMGLLFVRKISRAGVLGSWPRQEAGQTQLNFTATAVFKGLKKSDLSLQVLPNFTYSRNTSREDADSWGKETDTNFGAAVKYGITSSITAEATVKPDFSQVESDAYQVEVNQRYPIFYSEKRPFFMEGTDVLDFGLISAGMMVAAVHTRNIIDPDWAGKLSGSAGKVAFIVLAANDSAPGQPWSGSSANPNEGKKAFWGIARIRYSLGGDNALGVLYSGYHFAGSKNNVIGADFHHYLFKNARLVVSYLHSSTKESDDGEFKGGNAFNAMLQYSTSKLDADVAYERYDENFVMNSAFLRRSSIGRGTFFIGPNIYMKKIAWFQKIQPFVQYAQIHDLGTGMDDKTFYMGVGMNFTREGYLNIRYEDLEEAWAGQLFELKYLFLQGNIQLSKWLYVGGAYGYGDQIYYSYVDPFLGEGRYIKFQCILQPTNKSSLNYEFLHNTFYKKQPEKEKFYSVSIHNLFATYQFNKYFFVRAALRYNDYQKKLLTDFLASFTLIPGTVVHLGYGSLYENKDYVNNQWVPGDGSLLNTKNSLFFKVSYLWQIK